MKIIEKDGELMMRDFPTTNWAIGALLVFGSVIFLGGLIISVSKSSFHPTDIFITLVIVLIWYFAYQNLAFPVITTRVKPAEQLVEMTTFSPISIKKTRTFQFSEIKRFEMVSRKRGRSLLYVNSMILNDDSHIDLESEGYATNTISGISIRLNELLKKHSSGRKQK